MLLLAAPAAFAENGPPQLPGLHGPDRRIVLDASAPPWNAVARIQTNTGTRCTGALVAPAAVVTAAHCLYNRLTGRMLPPGSVHVLLGYRSDTWRWHSLAARYAIGPGFDGAAPKSHLGADWAWIDLAAAPPRDIAPFALATVPAPGTPVVLAGYNQDRTQLLMADRNCRVVGEVDAGNGSLLAHNCEATHGTSGGPLLEARDGAWRLVGLNVAAGESAGFAIPAGAIALNLP